MKISSEVLSKIANLNDEERRALAARMPLVNPDGHALSLYNNCLVALQSDLPCTVVGGFKHWLKKGRCVRKQQHAAAYILVPSRKRDSQQLEDGEKVFFLTKPVFDISQTDPIPSEAQPSE